MPRPYNLQPETVRSARIFAISESSAKLVWAMPSGAKILRSRNIETKIASAILKN